MDKIARALEATGEPIAVRTRVARLAVAESRSNGIHSTREIVERAHEILASESKAMVRPVVNMSGVVLHTALGRARLCREAVLALSQMDSHVSVELDWESGGRGDRQDAVRNLLTQLTAAEDALVVNNCAGALVLTLAALCRGREVVLSRGEMVEIGGSFRVPEIVEASGCRLVEVGCTNRTRMSDFEMAVTDDTAAFLKCHPSNYRIVGFTEKPSPADMAKLANERGLVLIDDLGQGCLIDTAAIGLPKERTLQEAVADGAHVVLASGDKLLGGPQSGLILGQRDLIAKIGRHPLARAFRVDKLTLAALEATLKVYVQGRYNDLPVWAAVHKPIDEVKRNAQSLARAYTGPAVVREGETQMGGGSLPEVGIPTWRAGLQTSSADNLLTWLRQSSVPVIGRIERGMVWLDPRTAEPHEVKLVAQALKDAPL